MQNVPNTVQFQPAAAYSSCLVLSRLLAYTDRADLGHLDDNVTAAAADQSPIRAYDAGNLTWHRELFEENAEHAHIDVTGTNPDWFGAAPAAVRFTLKAFGRRQYDLTSPHLLHSENGTQVALMLDQLNCTSAAEGDSAKRRQRFALEWFQVANETRRSNDAAAAEFAVQHRRVLDDEHTPGVFELRDIVSPATQHFSNGSYVHFRPVSYTSVTREMGASTAVHVQRPQNVTDAVQRLSDGGSLAWSFYGYALGAENAVLVQAYNVSFGEAGDGFYAKSHLNTW